MRKEMFVDLTKLTPPAVTRLAELVLEYREMYDLQLTAQLRQREAMQAKKKIEDALEVLEQSIRKVLQAGVACEQAAGG